MNAHARFGLTALLLALQGGACTAELVAVPMHDAGPTQPSDESRARPASRTNGAAGNRARTAVDVAVSVAGSGATPPLGVDAVEPPSDDGDDAGVLGPPDAARPVDDEVIQAPAPETPPGAPLAPLAPLAGDDCISDTTPGDRTYACNGLTFLLQIDPRCARGGCGLIVELHGRGSTAALMRETTRLHLLAPSQGFLVLHPSATPDTIGSPWTEEMYPQVADFVKRVIDVFLVDRSRVHVGGFSDGADLTFWFLCNHGELFASAAAASRVVPAIDCIGRRSWPRVPILYMHGTEDTLTIDAAREMIDEVVSRLSLGEGAAIEIDGSYTRTRYAGSDMALDYIEHAYFRLLGGGHCIPSGPLAPGVAQTSLSSCTLPEVQLDWGPLALSWFVAHPRGEVVAGR